MAFFVVTALSPSSFNLIADIIYAVLDPRSVWTMTTEVPITLPEPIPSGPGDDTVVATVDEQLDRAGGRRAQPGPDRPPAVLPPQGGDDLADRAHFGSSCWPSRASAWGPIPGWWKWDYNDLVRRPTADDGPTMSLRPTWLGAGSGPAAPPVRARQRDRQGHVRDDHARRADHARRDPRARHARRRSASWSARSPATTAGGSTRPDALHRRDHRDPPARHRRVAGFALGQRPCGRSALALASCGPGWPGSCAPSSSPCASGVRRRRAWRRRASNGGSSSSTSCRTPSARSSSASRC